jgi:hypothetical protein
MDAMPGDPLQQATDAKSSDPMGEVETGAKDDGKPPVYRVKADFQYDGALGISWVPDPGTGRPIIMAIKTDSSASYKPELRIGLILAKINGTLAIGKGYSRAIELLRESGRPLKLELLDEPRPLEVTIDEDGIIGITWAQTKEKVREGRGLARNCVCWVVL